MQKKQDMVVFQIIKYSFMINSSGHIMESPEHFTDKQVKHIAIQSLSPSQTRHSHKNHGGKNF